MRLLLVRHGESDWNATRQLQGQADIPLSARGRDQARRLRPVIEALAPDRIVASDLARAAETARILGVEARPEPGLREIDVGDWTGRPIEALRAEPGGAYAGWRAGTFTPASGEPWPAFRARTVGAIARARAQDVNGQAPRTLLAVCHGGVIRALLEHHVGLALDRLLPVGPGSVTILRLGAGDAARLEAYNHAPMLPDLLAPD